MIIDIGFYSQDIIIYLMISDMWRIWWVMTIVKRAVNRDVIFGECWLIRTQR